MEPNYGDEIIDLAVKRYTRDCERRGYLYQTPGRYNCEANHSAQTVTLANGNGHLARYVYKITKQGVVRFRDA